MVFSAAVVVCEVRSHNIAQRPTVDSRTSSRPEILAPARSRQSPHLIPSCRNSSNQAQNKAQYLLFTPKLPFLERSMQVASFEICTATRASSPHCCLESLWNAGAHELTHLQPHLPPDTPYRTPARKASSEPSIPVRGSEGVCRTGALKQPRGRASFHIAELLLVFCVFFSPPCCIACCARCCVLLLERREGAPTNRS